MLFYLLNKSWIWVCMTRGGIVFHSILLAAWMPVTEAYQRWIYYCMHHASWGGFSVHLPKYLLPLTKAANLRSTLSSLVFLTFQNLLLAPAVTFSHRRSAEKVRLGGMCVFVSEQGRGGVCWVRETSFVRLDEGRQWELIWHEEELSPQFIEIDCDMSVSSEQTQAVTVSIGSLFAWSDFPPVASRTQSGLAFY